MMELAPLTEQGGEASVWLPDQIFTRLFVQDLRIRYRFRT